MDCPTLGWQTKRRMLPRLTGLNNEILLFEGKKIHKMSWDLFPDGLNAQKQNIDSSAQYTKELLQNPENKTLFEASFVIDGYSVRTDVLQRDEEGLWNMFEVKSGNKYKAKYAQDMAFSMMVLRKAGIKTGKATLMCLSHGYRLGMDTSKLFTKYECGEKVDLRISEFMPFFDTAREEIESDEMPEPYLKRACKNCPVFDSCMGKDVKNHIFDLPRLSVPAIEELIMLGSDTIDKVPDDFVLTEMQQIVKNCVINNNTYVSENLKTELDAIKEPFYYLDFESVTTILPLYPDVAPHTQFLTQFSIDRCDKPGEIKEHFEYIADHTKDCRREIAEKLIECLKDEGSIITYANFERVAICKLAGMFKDLSEKLLKIADRIVDFEVLVRKNYYDINFHGRSSIKKVLPVMIKNMDYKDLTIGEGGDASAAFAFMAMGFYDNEKIQQTKKDLLKYCAQDTLAMVRMHQFLIDVANNGH